MSGYTSFWDCWICCTRQESMNHPKIQICEDCLRPVAARLCTNALGENVNLNTAGIDVEYWMRRADYTIEPMFRRYQRNRGDK